jgi:hypothetical protein
VSGRAHEPAHGTGGVSGTLSLRLKVATSLLDRDGLSQGMSLNFGLEQSRPNRAREPERFKECRPRVLCVESHTPADVQRRRERG